MIKAISVFVAYAVGFMLGAPKAIGIGLMQFIDTLPKAQFADGGSIEIKALETAVKDALTAMQDNIKKTQDLAGTALEEVKKEGTLHGETNASLKALGEKGNELATQVKAMSDRLQEAEQRLVARKTGDDEKKVKSLVDIILDSPEFKEAQKQPGSLRMAPVEVGNFHKAAAIYNAAGQNQPIAPAQRVPGFISPAEQRLTIRDLLPQSPTTSNLIEFAQEATFTSAAAPQGGTSSPAETEGQLKPQAGMTFTLQSSPVVTIAHWIAASRQVLSDASLLAGHINGRLVYGLKLEEENEILNGTGASGTLNGLINQATAFNAGSSNATQIDNLLRAMTQVSLSFYETNGVVLHPSDWTSIMLLKDTQGRYLFSDPQNMVDARIWGKPVVATPSMGLGKMLVGAFGMAAQIWDREDANVRVSENVNDHFIRNMVAILAEERLALTVYRPASIVYGSLQG